MPKFMSTEVTGLGRAEIFPTRTAVSFRSSLACSKRFFAPHPAWKRPDDPDAGEIFPGDEGNRSSFLNNLVRGWSGS